MVSMKVLIVVSMTAAMTIMPQIMYAQPYTLWTGTYGGSDWEHMGEAIQTPDGGYVVAGATWSYTRACKVYLVRTDSEGTVLWEKLLGGFT